MNRRQVLLSQAERRNVMLRKKIDHTCFECHFLDILEQTELSRFDLVVPLRLQDICYLNDAFGNLRGVKFLVPTNATMDLAHHKPSFNQFLIENGYSEFVPPTGNSLYFPYVLKQNIDAGGANSFLINSRADEQQHHSRLHDPDYFRQAYVPGNVEYTDHLVFDGTIRHAFTVRFNMNRDFYIRGVKIQPYTNVQIGIIPSEFGELFGGILSQMQFQGVCCFNYKIVDNRPQIFELNPRMGGSAHFEINPLLDTLLGAMGKDSYSGQKRQQLRKPG